MSVPYLSLLSEYGDIYNFEPDFWLKDDGWKLSSNIENKVYAAGGLQTADGYLEARNILIEGFLRGSTLLELETKTRALQKAILLGGYLSVSDDIITRSIKITNAQVSSNYSNDYRLEKAISISFTCEYPFWQGADETFVSETLTLGSTYLYAENSESDFIVYPIITIIADQGVNIPSVSLVNQSDGNMTLDYNNSDFISGDTLVIDCIEGTIKRNDNLEIQYMTGAFIRLLNVNNKIEYNGEACTLTITGKKVYL